MLADHNKVQDTQANSKPQTYYRCWLRFEIRWVHLLLNPQISNLKSLKKDVQINTCAGKQASEETVRTDVTRTAGREQKTSTGNWKMGIKLN